MHPTMEIVGGWGVFFLLIISCYALNIYIVYREKEKYWYISEQKIQIVIFLTEKLFNNFF